MSDYIILIMSLIYTVKAKIIWTQFFSPAKNAFKSVISIFSMQCLHDDFIY